MATAARQAGAGRLRASWASRAPWQRVAAVAVGIATLLTLAAATVAGVAYYNVYTTASIPSPDQLEQPDPTVVLDRHGEQITTLEPAELRRNIDIDDLPDHVPAAVLAAEDRRFHEHGGFSVRSMARAAWANLTAGEIEQGASTIHQQYVSMAIAEISGGYPGKFREAVLAARLDSEVDKETVLEMYLNTVPFGRTARGIEAAARTYFNVGAEELDVNQAALLAGMIAAPSAFDPADHPEAATHRRNFVLDGLHRMGELERDEAEELLHTDLPELREAPLVSFDENAFFLSAVRDQVPELLEDDRVDPTMGLVIHTTLDPRAQALAVEELNTRLGETSYDGAVTTIEADSGRVRALVGGLDFEREQYNVALSGNRQPGSAFKTFVLAELVRQGYDPDATRIDAPREYEVEVEGGEDATVGNYSNRGHGEISARQATVDSVNTAYIQLAEDLGPDRVAELANDMGIGTELHEYPSLALGTAEVRPIDMTAAYATLAAEGTRHEPYLVERIASHDGEVIYEHEAEAEDVLEPDEANAVTDVLVDVVESGTGVAADLSRPNAGKTGTTNDYRDAWFVGYTPRHATTVWVGHNDNAVMEGDITGGSYPARIWGGYMEALLEDVDVEEFAEPDTSGLEALTELEAPDHEHQPEEAPTDRDAPAEREEDEEDEKDEKDDEDEDEQDEDEEGDGDDESDEEDGGEDDGAVPDLPGDENGDGDSTDGDSSDGGSDGDSTDGDSTDGDSTDGDSTDGSTDGDSTDGDSDGDSTDGDSTDGDSTDGDTA